MVEGYPTASSSNKRSGTPTERRGNGLVLGGQIGAAVTALAFMAVALVRFYDSTMTAFGFAANRAYPWATEALVLATAALAFGLTLARQRSSATIVSLVVAIAVALGSAIYAATQQASYTATRPKRAASRRATPASSSFWRASYVGVSLWNDYLPARAVLVTPKPAG